MNLFSCADVAIKIGRDESTIRRQAARAWQKHGGPGPLLKHEDWVVVGQSASEGGKGCGWQLKNVAEFNQGAWQPIDTAPKDGTEILASDYDAIEIVSWCEQHVWEGWGNREGQIMFPAWWQSLPDHPPLPKNL